MKLRPFTLLASSAIAAFVAAACGGSSPSSGFDPDAGGGGDGGGQDGSVVNGDGGPSLNGGDAGDAAPAFGCSPDLRNVVDGAGTVIKTCSADQGCAAGACVPACDAAAASHGSLGCDYVVATPSFFAGQGYPPPCFAIFVANSWAKEMKLTVTRGGTSYDVTKFGHIPDGTANAAMWPAVPATGLPPGKVAVLFMSEDPGSSFKCPVANALGAGSAVIGTGKGQAWHVQSDVPVTAYDILPFGGASSYLPSAELLLPTTAWGTNYVASLPKFGDYSNGAQGPHWGQIVAAQDNTTVKLVPTVALPAGGGVAAAPPNALATYTLNAGEYIQWQGQENTSMEMSGTILQSDKPIAFNAGNGYLCLMSKTTAPVGGNGGGCDSGHQQIPPVSALGSEYSVPPYATRRADLQEESIPYRLVGAVDGTTLTFDPPIAGAPPTLKAGFVADFEAVGPFVVKSQDDQHPFYVAQMMSGCYQMSGSRNGSCIGDEEYVNILPPAQYLSQYVFFTDPTYDTTNLVLTRTKTASGFKDVNVDCVGNVTGWKPLGTSGKYEVTNVDLVRGTTPVGTCSNGPHLAKSDGPFGLLVWGLSDAASYAYPAGGNVATINTVVVPPTPR